MYTASPPWEVPKKRKTRGILKGGRDCYDPHEGNMYTLEGGEVTTHNRYSPLINNNDEMKEVLQNNDEPPDSSPVQEEKNQRIVYFENLEEFMRKNYVHLDNDKYDDCICIKFTNKYNFCSGYSPDFIPTLPINNDFKYFIPTLPTNNYKPFSKYNNNRFSSKHLPGYERVAKSSERGTLGEYHNYAYYGKVKNNNTNNNNNYNNNY